MTAAPPDRLSAVEIAREIERSRERLSQDLSRIDREYGLRHLVVRGERLIAAEASAGDLRDRLGRDALPLALIGVGIAWLTLAGRQEGADLAGRFTRTLSNLRAVAQTLPLLGLKAPQPGDELEPPRQ